MLACKTLLHFIPLMRSVAEDCGIDSYTTQYCIRRLENEGVSFWVSTLPKLSRVLITSLEKGTFERGELTCFAWKGRSLRIFRSLLDSIFCRKTGKILDNPDPYAINSIRQFCEYTYKLSFEATSEDIQGAKDIYQATQKELADLNLLDEWVELLRKHAETYYAPLFKASPDKILSYGPQDGPGTFSGSSGKPLPFNIWKKLPVHVIGTCDRSMKPYSGYFKAYPSSPETINLVEESRISEVLFVPKDARGPRVISKEPLFLLKAQMAFFKFASSTLAYVSGHRINFADQLTNRELARVASITGKFATIDLSRASDRVSYRLIKRIFQNAPGISWLLKNSRSTHYKLPGSSEVFQQYAVAGMGSGFTFPLLAFLCHISVCLEVSKTTSFSFREAMSQVYVYGDDIIVPTLWYDAAINGLSKSGLVVNTEKSFRKGGFRESCGGDYYRGNECMPTRLRLNNASLSKKEHYRNLEITVGRKDGNLIVALVRHAYECHLSGLISTRDFFEGILQRLIPMPIVGIGSGVLGRLRTSKECIPVTGTGGDSSAPDGYVLCAVPRPVLDTYSKLCPYKFLSASLSRKADILSHLSDDDGVGYPYGVIPRPRSNKVVIRKQSVLTCYSNIAGT